jgi:hypothetical protein
MHLHELTGPHGARISHAADPAAWTASFCDVAHAVWIAWNVREDAWYGPEELEEIRAAIDAAPPDVHGPDLLIRIAGKLRALRVLTAKERPHLPPGAINHVAASDFRNRYELTPDSAFAEGTLEAEIGSAWSPGDRFRLMPKKPRFAWLTFDAGGRPVPRDPDQILRNLGLDWKAAGCVVLRVEVPLGKLLAAGVGATIPTIFNNLCYGPPIRPDWRARPSHEHRDGEPWGMARDMLVDGPALPEVIMEITEAGVMDAECMGAPVTDWSVRPYLTKGGPR